MLKVSRILQADASSVNNFVKEAMRILDPEGKYPMPVIKIVNLSGTRWLGRCTSTTSTVGSTINSVSSVIQLQQYILADDTTLQKVISHECCHHVVISNFCVGQDRKTSLAAYDRDGGHGPSFFKMASKINAVLGADFVTEHSDESYVLTEGTEVYLFMWERSPGDILYCWAARPSAKQITYVKRRKCDNPDQYKLTKTRDPHLQPHNCRIGDGWVVEKPGPLKDSLKELWDNASDLTEQLADKQPTFTIILKQGGGVINAWKADKLTSRIQDSLKMRFKESYEVRTLKSQDQELYKELEGFSSLRYRGRQPGDYDKILKLWDQARPLAYTAA